MSIARMLGLLWRLGVALAVLASLFAGLVWALTWHPAEVQAEAVSCSDDAPLLPASGSVRVLNWNVQYMAGKDYVFWYDLLDGSGPDLQPSRESIDRTIAAVARVIREEAPDVILLQEVDDGAERTYREDQVGRLLALLPEHYACQTSAYYWKATYVPERHVRGAVGMKLVTISRYRISAGTRYQLPRIPADPVTREFYLKRAVLHAVLPREGGGELVVMNTHLDAFAQGSDTMQRQVARVRELLAGETAAGRPWLIGGDFNLLPPGPQYANLAPAFRAYYQPQSELRVLLRGFSAVPAADVLSGSDSSAWYTHYPNDPAAGGPDRTIDYVFYSPLLRVTGSRVRQGDTLKISDHLPIVATFAMP